MPPFAILQSLVLDPSTDLGEYQFDLFLKRLKNALDRVGNTTSASDLAVLIRQGIIRSHLAFEGEKKLRVPRKLGWPDETMWSEFMCTASPYGLGHYVVEPEKWEPPWLEGASDLIDASIKEESRRENGNIPADPLVKSLINIETYLSPGQREAVRASFFAHPESVVVVHLSTGSGKSLVFQLPALVRTGIGDLMLVIVPTVALAQDQEERFMQMLTETGNASRYRTGVAYHGGLSDDAKGDIREAIRNGTIPIVFTSPESALGALRSSLIEVARQGRLKSFIIDEAHMVSQWGQNFRPEYQALAGFRQTLLEASPPDASFPTFLMTATLTAETIKLLKGLFKSERFEIVSEASLRPEPAFLYHNAVDQVERMTKIREIVRFLPRPLILYTSKRGDAELYHSMLREMGFQRTFLARGGDLSTTRGAGLLKDWRDRRIDAVVATSAFGLGVDLPEVRSIVHACLPETIDRFYQEVGRGGRDGKASVALLITTPTDIRVASNLAQDCLITVDRAFVRWKAMWAKRSVVDGWPGTFSVSLDSAPPDIDADSDLNAAWNLRVLILMVAAQLINLVTLVPPTIDHDEGEIEEDYEEKRRELFRHFYREVGIRRGKHFSTSEEEWKSKVCAVRTELRLADREDVENVTKLMDLDQPYNEIFRKLYTIPEHEIYPPEFLGSCPYTRANGQTRFEVYPPEIRTLTRLDIKLKPDLQRVLAVCTDKTYRSWISYEQPVSKQQKKAWKKKLLSLMRYFVEGGVVELAYPSKFLSNDEEVTLCEYSPYNFVAKSSLDKDSSNEFTMSMPIPRLSVLESTSLDDGLLQNVLSLQRPYHIILLPNETRDPLHNNRRIFDVLGEGCLSLDDVLERMN